ncbi:MAG: DUF4105 domain-containing protein [bacterium]|nr:DUF4105 domain-containing protein [bacterium]
MIMRSVCKKILKIVVVAIIFPIIAYFVFAQIVQPSLNRNWTNDQRILAHANFNEDRVKITNIRNINYRATDDYDVRYYDKTFDLNKIESVWFMVEPFSGHGFGAAHTLLSFGFENGDYVAISVEIRKESDESFSAVGGLFRQYELVYVIADEQDVIKLRSNYRKDKVFLYPTQTSKENMRALFVSMLERANKLASEPEFYNTLTSTCTTNIVAHINKIVEGRVPFSFKVLMPAYSDELAQKLGLINNLIPLEELRAKYLINDRAEKYADDPNWSQRIREIDL